MLVHKVAGAAAAAGLQLDDVAAEASAAAAGLGTMGVALGPCTVPAAGKPGFSLDDGEMELGLGIHGEQGVRRVRLEAADKVVEVIVDTLLARTNLPDRRVALLVNGPAARRPWSCRSLRVTPWPCCAHAVCASSVRGAAIS